MTILHHLKNALRMFLLGCAALPFVVCSGTGGSAGAQLVPGDSLSAADAAFIKEKKFLGDSERVVFLYVPAKSAKKQGVLLTDRKVLVFEGDKVKKAAYTDIYDLSTAFSDTSIKQSVITIEPRKDSVFTCQVSPVNQVDQKFYAKLMDLWQAGKDGPAGATAASQPDTGGSFTFGVTVGNQKSAPMQLKGPGAEGDGGASAPAVKKKK